MPTRFCIRTP